MASKQLHPIIRAHYRKMGKKGGKGRAAKLSPQRRQEIARSGGKAKARKRSLDNQAEEGYIDGQEVD
jgi:general stress protein YciG